VESVSGELDEAYEMIGMRGWLYERLDVRE
jgi:hypothetical protein